ncbi:hypothetical protein TWF718_009732 [Orbilia javanica]|uniref:Carrier domain-containing protein n=1 Tax=Orbilia javanica TaxID=47235 RepID=A0AAN8RLM7_9PEZI
MSTLRRPFTSEPELPACGFIQLFLNRVKEFPEKVAVIDGDRAVTYAQLLEKVKQFSFLLRGTKEIVIQEPISVLVPKGLDHIIAQMAIIFCGGTCLPLDPTWSNEELQSRQSSAGSKLVIADQNNMNRLPLITNVLISFKDLDKITGSHEIEHTPTTSEFRSHILFSSGTTGTPKGIQILARGIYRLNHWFQFRPSDRIAHVNNVVFDACIQDIWCPLISGSTVVNIPKDVLLDPFRFMEMVKTHRITWILLTNALFNAIAVACPTAFATIDVVLAAGDAPNTSIMKLVLENGPPGRLLNGYGPAECSVLSSTYDITIKDTQLGTMSIGRPLFDGDYHVLNEDLNPVIGTDVGELYISGPGISAGYLNRPDLNEKSFLTLNLAGNDQPLRVYKTGDLVRYREGSDLLEYVGRRDHQIKLSGHRVELEVIEAFFANTGLVSAVAVLKIQPKVIDAAAFLQAYVVLKPEADLKSLSKKVKQKYPENLAPRITEIDRLPLTPNGKADRKILEALCLESIGQNLLETKQGYDTGAEAFPTIARLKSIWSQILFLPFDKIQPTDKYFSIGGTSINITTLISKVYRTFNFSMSAAAIYEHQTLRAMSTYIESGAVSGVSESSLREVRDSMINDPLLADTLVPLPGPVPVWRSTREGDVLLTGATGFLGAFFLQALLELPEIRKVRCLVRAKTPQDGELRIRKNLKKYRLSISDFLMTSKLSVLVGDLAEPSLGLRPAIYDQVARSCSAIFHLGAHVNYVQPYNLHRPANIIGTLNILRLAVTGKKKSVHYSSSIGAYGPQGLTSKATAKPLAEDKPLDAFLDGLVHDLGYSQSQFATEQLVWRALQRGLPVSIYRPGFILGHSKTGYGNPDDFFGRLVTGCFSTGFYPLLKQRKQCIPVDQVAKQLLHISSNNDNIGHAYNLVPLKGSGSSELLEAFEMIKKSTGANLQGLPYQQWLQHLLKQNKTNSSLEPLIPMFQEKVFGELTRWELHENPVYYEVRNTRRAIADSDDPEGFLSLGKRLLKLYVARWLEQGGNSPMTKLQCSSNSGQAIKKRSDFNLPTAGQTPGPMS